MSLSRILLVPFFGNFLGDLQSLLNFHPELAERVDAFVSEHMGVLRESRAFFALPRIDVEGRGRSERFAVSFNDVSETYFLLLNLFINL